MTDVETLYISKHKYTNQIKTTENKCNINKKTYLLPPNPLTLLKGPLYWKLEGQVS